MSMMSKFAPIKNDVSRFCWFARFKTTMGRMIFECHKIFWPVIIFFPVEMMAFFARLKIPTDDLLDYKPVLQHAAPLSAGMAKCRAHNISPDSISKALRFLESAYALFFPRLKRSLFAPIWISLSGHYATMVGAFFSEALAQHGQFLLFPDFRSPQIGSAVDNRFSKHCPSLFFSNLRRSYVSSWCHFILHPDDMLNAYKCQVAKELT